MKKNSIYIDIYCIYIVEWKLNEIKVYSDALWPSQQLFREIVSPIHLKIYTENFLTKIVSDPMIWGWHRWQSSLWRPNKLGWNLFYIFMLLDIHSIKLIAKNHSNFIILYACASFNISAQTEKSFEFTFKLIFFFITINQKNQNKTLTRTII